MAQGISFGQEIPDQFNTITASLSTHLHLTHDVSTFLSERAALEREYSTKLSALTRKVKEKREKRLMECVVGPEPAKVWNPQVGDRSTLQKYLSSAIAATESVAADHNSLGGKLEVLANDVDTGANKGEEMRKKHNAFYQKLIADREKTYADRVKSKSKYDETCHELESQRAKVEKAEQGDKHTDRAKKGLQAAEEEMWNAKNTYLVSIAASNRAQSRFYSEDLPRVQDDLQSLLTLTATTLTTNVQRLHTQLSQHSDQITKRTRSIESDAQSVNTTSDQSVFSEFNKRRFDLPRPFAFEPCQGFFDTEEMSIESTSAQTYLQNMLLRKQSQLSEMIPLIEAKAKEIAGLTNLRDAYLSKQGLGDPAEVTDQLLESIRGAIALEVAASLLDAEIETISASIGSDHLRSARPHQFESKTFTIPATCALCQGKIFGLHRQASVCKSCSYTCHQKCEPKVPAECRAARGGASSSTSGLLARTASVRTASGGGAAATTPSASTPPTTTRRTLPPSSSSSSSARTATAAGPRAKALYAYDATSSNELSITQGQILSIIQDDDDGSGWITVSNDSGQKGLVPENYTQRVDGAVGNGDADSDEDEEDDDTDSEEEGTAPTQRVKALYSHTASAPDELSIEEGETIILTATGFDVGNGWCEGVNTSGQRGIFPANYVERL